MPSAVACQPTMAESSPAAKSTVAAAGATGTMVINGDVVAGKPAAVKPRLDPIAGTGTTTSNGDAMVKEE
ncbi:hypothetical protein GUJ93_ZPchr0006g40755 [Zizania palustris]|uniref:Uncharacterized protein n=1 Tax=Zizania palustris TaxID=103762 RepID=A0A8J5VNA8_ZIZPA|nr:hypothetical protein GUJ93_ZPchr0006g40755 [Zizania palustris]